MKYSNLLFLLCCTSLLLSQRFSELAPNTTIPATNLPEVNQSIVFHDVNGDSYPDAFVVEKSGSNKIYINDKQGGFNVKEPALPRILNAVTAFEDVNGDKYPDLLIMGNLLQKEVIKLYLNDGQGNFKEKENTPFVTNGPSVGGGTISFGDINGDKFVDVLIGGAEQDFFDALALYTNDGAGNFTRINVPFSELEFIKTLGSGLMMDIDGDKDLDVLTTSLINPAAPTGYVQLFINNGVGVFTKKVSPFIWGDVNYVYSIMSKDLNGDQLPDVVLSGQILKEGTTSTLKPATRVWINKDKGVFSEVENLEISRPQFIDLNNDAYPDLLGHEFQGIELKNTKTYINDGKGKFTAVALPFNSEKSTMLSSVDLNNNKRTYIFGTQKIYAQNSTGTFEILSPTGPVGWPNFANSTGYKGSFIDINNDKHQDVILTGAPCRLLMNDGKGNFASPSSPFPTAFYNLAVADFNGDKYQDVLFSNLDISKIFLSSGNGKFGEVLNNPFVGLNGAEIAVGDVNGDNAIDVIITGTDKSNVAFAALYINDGGGKFTQAQNTPFKGSYEGAVLIADLNGDKYNDVFINDKYYTNDGKGIFTEVLGTPFKVNGSNSAAIADVNGDKFLDVIISGFSQNPVYTTKLYINDGKGTFTEATNANFDQVGGGKIAFIDADKNLYPDVVISGYDHNNAKKTALYINDGKGGFNKANDTPLIGLFGGSISVSDVNGDLFDDMLIMGYDAASAFKLKMYINNKITTSTIDDDTFQQLYTLYPNPVASGSQLKILFNSIDNNDIDIHLIDYLGRQVHYEEHLASTGQNEVTLNLPNLAIGIYFLKMQNGKKEQTIKLMVR